MECLLKFNKNWSGRVDLNHRPSEPHSDTLPDCATPRHALFLSEKVITTIKEACQGQTKVKDAGK